MQQQKEAARAANHHFYFYVLLPFIRSFSFEIAHLLQYFEVEGLAERCSYFNDPWGKLRSSSNESLKSFRSGG